MEGIDFSRMAIVVSDKLIDQNQIADMLRRAWKHHPDNKRALSLLSMSLVSAAKTLGVSKRELLHEMERNFEEVHGFNEKGGIKS